MVFKAFSNNDFIGCYKLLIVVKKNFHHGLEYKCEENVSLMQPQFSIDPDDISFQFYRFEKSYL